MKKFAGIFLISSSLYLTMGCQTMSGNSLFMSPANADKATIAAITNAYEQNGQLAGAPIHVEVNHGTALLTGYVKTIRQSDVAGDIASKVPGVKAVENNLIVRK